MNWVQLFETWSMLSVANWTLLYFNGFGLGSAIELTQMFCQLNTIKHSKIKHFFNQTESNSRKIELCHWPALCHSKPVETVCCGQISYVWASILSTYTQPIWKRFRKWNLQFLNRFSKAITSALSPSVLEKILITLLEGKGGDWGSALKVFEENNRGQLGHLQCTMQTGVCAYGPWLIGSIKFRNRTREFGWFGNWTYRKVPVRLCLIAEPIGKQLTFTSNSIKFDCINFDWFFIPIHSIG